MQDWIVIVRVFIFVSIRPFDAHQLGLIYFIYDSILVYS